ARGGAGGGGAAGGGAAGTAVSEESDSYGYRWVIIEQPLVEDLVTRAHMANATLEDRGFGPQLLCSVFGLRNVDASGLPGGTGPGGGGSGPLPAGGRAYLVYLFKRGTFYPFVPKSGETRDNELEMRLRGILEHELSLEEDLTRWFPLWGLPLR
ncbi:MAG: PspA-associated protein PspAB, partial [Acidimicrobiales bacterium]